MVLIVVATIAFVVFAAASIGTALVVGEREERSAAVACLIAIFATQAASLPGPHWHQVEWGVLVVDAAFAMWLSIVACRSTKWWPIWAAAAQVAGTLCHAPIAVTDLPKWLYLFIQPLWAFAVLAALNWGVISIIRTR